MSSRRKMEDRIKKKEAEIQELEFQIREAKAYIQAMQDAMKLLPRDDGVPAETVLRAGSAVAQAREAILAVGQPLHISQILGALGREVNRTNSAGLSGSIAAYVRRGEIFTRPAPNTFGLVEMNQSESPNNGGGIDREGHSESVSQPVEPPANFGTDDDEEVPF